MKNNLEKILYAISTFFFPQDEDTRILETMDIETFRRRVRVEEPAPEGIEAFFSYHDPLIRLAIREMKYHKNPKALSLLAALTREKIIESLAEKSLGIQQKYYLVAIPESASRRNTYGFNQIELLIKKIAEIDGGINFVSLPNALLRSRETVSQVSLPRKERLKNMKGIFKANPQAMLDGRSILVLDDVTTTGSTLFEAKRAFKSAGVSSISLFAVAH